MIAIIGGSFDRFCPLIDSYYEAGHRAGHAPYALKVAVHAMGFVGETDKIARDAFDPGWARMLNEIGRDCRFPPASRGQFDRLCGPEGAFLVGSPQAVVEKKLAANEIMGGLARVTFQKSIAMLEIESMQQSITLPGTKIAPRVRTGLNTVSTQ